MAQASTSASPKETAEAPRTENTELLWVDCEMTGLDLGKDCVIEYASIVTDGDLNPLDDGVQWIIRADKALLDGMDEWCTNQHGSVRWKAPARTAYIGAESTSACNRRSRV